MKKYLMLSYCILFGLISAQAQTAQSPALAYSNAQQITPLVHNNPIEEHLFKPELVMKHQRALNLSAQQKDAILDAYQKAQAEFTRWQWDLQASTEELTELVSKEKIEEQKALQHLEKMLDLERNIKRTQLGLMIKIKNLLTVKQQKKLKELSGNFFWGRAFPRDFRVTPKANGQGFLRNNEN